MHRFQDQQGATAVEYGIITGLVGLGVVVLGPMLQQAFLHLLDVVLDAML